MGQPHRMFKVASIVWAILLGGLVIFISGAMLLPSTKSSRISAERLKEMAAQRARDEAAAAAESATLPTGRMGHTKYDVLRLVPPGETPLQAAVTPESEPLAEPLFSGTKSTILDFGLIRGPADEAVSSLDAASPSTAPASDQADASVRPDQN